MKQTPDWFHYLLLIILPLMIVGLASPAKSRRKKFDPWLKEFKQEARNEGVADTTLRELEDEFDFEPELLSNADTDQQAEFSVTFEEYKSWFINEEMISEGVRKYQEYGDTLGRIRETYKVPGEYLLAIWGIESRYGSHDYEHELLPSLVTMAYGHPRLADYFRSELMTLLQIHDEIENLPENLRGSWAGAMGQPQFLPSAYQNYAVDFDGSGWADIWKSEADILASIANYLRGQGWRENGGCAVELEKDDPAPARGRVVTTGDTDSRRFLMGDNFKALHGYNQSNHYVLTVCQLAEAIKKRLKKSDEKPGKQN